MTTLNQEWANRTVFDISNTVSIRLFILRFVMAIVTPEFLKLFKDYPLRSQAEAKDPLVVAKVFDTFGSATWYMLEYDPIDKITFCYVTGLAQDEFGYSSLTEMEEIMHPTFKIPRIERDLYFNQAPLSKFVKID